MAWSVTTAIDRRTIQFCSKISWTPADPFASSALRGTTAPSGSAQLEKRWGRICQRLRCVSFSPADGGNSPRRKDNLKSVQLILFLDLHFWQRRHRPR
jgi:hypothetical protein